MAVERDEYRSLAPGLGAIAVVCAPVVWTSLRADDPFATPLVVTFLATVAAFAAVFAMLVVRPAGPRRTRALIAAQSALALLANWLIPMCLPGVALTGILLAVAAAPLARLRRGVAIAWIAAQTTLLFAIYGWGHAWPLGTALSATIGYGLMQVVLESIWRFATLERARRIELDGAMRELRSTQAMLTETVRAAQRSEIARNLHDVVGHHLVALGMQLDAAIATGERTRLVEARQLVRRC